MRNLYMYSQCSVYLYTECRTSQNSSWEEVGLQQHLLDGFDDLLGTILSLYLILTFAINDLLKASHLVTSDWETCQ